MEDFTMCADCGDWGDQPEGSYCPCGGLMVHPAADEIPPPRGYRSHAEYLLEYSPFRSHCE